MYTSPYIGKTGLIDAVIRAKFPDLRGGKLEPIYRCLMFTGPPGVAKTMLAVDLANTLAEHPANVTFKIGSAISTEMVRDWRSAAPYRSLFPGLTVRVIDEVNTVTATAVNELREHLFFLPRWEVVFATTNLPPNQLQEPLQSRFKIQYFDRIPISLVTPYLAKEFPDVSAAELADIARKTGGNVRAAKLDADTARDVIRYQQLAA